MEREERSHGLAAAGDLAEQEGGETDARTSRRLRVVGQAAAEAEVARRVHTVDEIQTRPPLIGAQLDHVPPLSPSQTIGELNCVLAAMSAGETAARRTDGQDAVNLHRRERVLREDRWETELGRPALVKAWVDE